MKDFSIVIAHRGSPMGLWLTIQASEMQLQQTDITREYIVVSNGMPESGDTANHMKSLERGGLLAHYSHRDDAMSPPSARNFGVKYATGKYLCFFDNHCLPLENYFARAKADFEHFGMDALHSAHKYDAWDTTRYHYTLKLNRNFWANETQEPQHNLKPYPIAMGGHGGFFVKADTFREVGGYWDGFQGYAGEEPYFDLKLALLDKQNYIDPRIVHIHYVGERGYARHYSDDFCRNMMMSANIIGGEKWLYKVFESLSQSTRVGSSQTPMYDLLIQAEERSRARAAWLASIRKRTLDEQLEYFVQKQIAH